jgi:serine protease Do
MKKMILRAILPGLLTGLINTASAQKNKSDNDRNEDIIIMKHGGKDTKLTIETRDGQVYINGKPESEFKDDNVSIIRNRRGGRNYLYTPGGDLKEFSGLTGEKRAFLGVTTESADKGVRITDVEKGSAADKAGLKEGDVITKLGNAKVEDPDDLMDAVTSHKPKEDVKVYYERNGKSNDVKATLGSKSENGFRTFSFNGPRGRNGDLFDGYEFNKEFNKNFNRQFQYKMPAMPPMALAPGHLFNNTWRWGNKRLGVRIEDTENDSGVKITNVEENSAAEKAGLKKDDIITEVEGKKVEDVGDVLDEVRENSDKGTFKIKAKRNGSEMNFDIKFPKELNNADL